MAQSEHDGTDHGDQKDEACNLEVVDVVGIEDPAERLGVAQARRYRIGESLGGGCREFPQSGAADQFKQKHDTDAGADQNILLCPALQFGEIDIEHHDDEKKKNGDRADIDDDQDHGEKLGPEEHEEPCSIEEGKNEEQHRVHRVARRDDHEGRRKHDRGKEVKCNRLQHSALPVWRVEFEILGNLAFPAIAVR